MTDTEKLDLILSKAESFATKEEFKAYATKEDLRRETNVVLKKIKSIGQGPGRSQKHRPDRTAGRQERQ